MSGGAIRTRFGVRRVGFPCGYIVILRKKNIGRRFVGSLISVVVNFIIDRDVVFDVTVDVAADVFGLRTSFVGQIVDCVYLLPRPPWINEIIARRC